MLVHTNHSQHRAGTYRYLMCMSGIGLLAIAYWTGTGHIKANYGYAFGAGAGATLSQVSYNRDTLLPCPATAMHA